MLKAQDVVAVVVASRMGSGWTFVELADRLDLSASQVHASLRRAEACGLWWGDRRAVLPGPFVEFAAHGLRYVFPPETGGQTTGRRTAHAAPPLADQIVAPPESAWVWPDPGGEHFGRALLPLHPSAYAAARDTGAYEVLALLDALRVGRARERALATSLLGERLSECARWGEAPPWVGSAL